MDTHITHLICGAYQLPITSNTTFYFLYLYLSNYISSKSVLPIFLRVKTGVQWFQKFLSHVFSSQMKCKQVEVGFFLSDKYALLAGKFGQALYSNGHVDTDDKKIYHIICQTMQNHISAIHYCVHLKFCPVREKSIPGLLLFFLMTSRFLHDLDFDSSV